MIFLTKNGNWKYLSIAFISALVLWYTFNAKEQVERVLDVILDYKGLPQNLIVTEGQLNKISVRIRGSLEMLRSFSGRELSYTIDLSGVTPGTNTIPLSSIQFSELRTYQLLEVTPPRMILKIDKLKEIKLPISLQIRPSIYSDSIFMEDIHIVPHYVLVRGPTAIVDSMSTVIAEVSANIEEEGHTVKYDASLLAPQSVELIPHVINVCFRLGVQRQSISLQKKVLLSEEKEHFVIKPQYVDLVVSIPESLLNNPEYLSQIYVTVDTANLQNSFVKNFDVVKSNLKVNLPFGSKLIKIVPDVVSVYRKK